MDFTPRQLVLLAISCFSLALFGGWFSENINQPCGDVLALFGLLGTSTAIVALWLEWEER